MKVEINQDKCIGCGSCVSITNSQVFDFNDDGKAQEISKEVPEGLEEDTKTAIEYCPTGAIEEKQKI